MNLAHIVTLKIGDTKYGSNKVVPSYLFEGKASTAASCSLQAVNREAAMSTRPISLMGSGLMMKRPSNCRTRDVVVTRP